MPTSADSIKDPAGAPGAEKDIVGGEAKKPFDLKAALDDPEFRNFSSGYGDAERVDKIPTEELGKRYEAFQNKKALEAALQNFFEEEINANLGVSLGSEGKRVLFEYLEKAARENPERLRELAAEWKAVEAKKKEIADNDALIARLGGEEARAAKLAELKTEEEKLYEQKKFGERYMDPIRAKTDKARKFLSSPGTTAISFFLSGGVWAFRKAEEKGLLGIKVKEGARERQKFEKMPEKERSEFFAGVDKKIAEFGMKRKGLEAASGRADAGKEYKALFDETRKAFFGAFEGTKAVYAAVLAKAWEEAAGSFAGGNLTLESGEKIQAALDRFQKIKDSLPPGVELPATRERLNEMQNSLNDAIESVSRNIVSSALEKYRPGVKVVNELEELLKPVEGKERLGARKGEAVHEFVRGEVEKHRDFLTERLTSIDAEIKAAEAAKNDARGELEYQKNSVFVRGPNIDRTEKDLLEFGIGRIEKKISGLDKQIKKLGMEKQNVEEKRLALGEFLAVSRAGAEKRAAEAAAKEADIKAEEDKKKIIENFEKQLKEKRGAYMAAYKEYRASKAPENKFPLGEYGLPVGIEYSRADKFYREYSQFLEAYAKTLYGHKKEELVKRGLSGEKLANELAEFQAVDIFSRFFINEQKDFDKEKAGIWPPKQRMALMKGLGKWSRLPKPVRWGISTALATGLAVAGGLAATGGAAGVLMFAGYRYGRVALSAFTVAGANKLFEKITRPLLVKSRERAIDELSRRENLVDNLVAMREEYKKVLEEAAKREKRANIAKFIVGVAAGGSAIVWGGALDHAFADASTAVTERWEAAATPPEAPSSEFSFEHGSARAVFDKDGDIVNFETQTSFKGLDGTEYMSPAAKSHLDSVTPVSGSSMEGEVAEAGEQMLRMEGKHLAANIRLYHELQEAGKLKEAASLKGEIESQVARLTESRGADFLDKGKLTDFWGRVHEIPAPPGAPEAPPTPAPEAIPESAPVQPGSAEAPPPPPGEAISSDRVVVGDREITFTRGADGKITGIGESRLGDEAIDAGRVLRGGANESLKAKFAEQTTAELSGKWSDLQSEARELDERLQILKSIDRTAQRDAAEFLLKDIESRVAEIERDYGASALDRGRFPDYVERYLKEGVAKAGAEIEAMFPKIQGEGTEYFSKEINDRLHTRFRDSSLIEWEQADKELEAWARNFDQSMREFGELKAGNPVQAGQLLERLGKDIDAIEAKYGSGVINRSELPKYLEEYLSGRKLPADLSSVSSGEAPPSSAGGRLEAIPAEESEAMPSETVEAAISSRQIDIYGQELRFSYDSKGKVVGLEAYAKEAAFPERILRKYEIWEADPQKFFTKGALERAQSSGRLDELVAKGRELDQTRKTYEALAKQFRVHDLPTELKPPELLYLGENMRRQVSELEFNFGDGVLDHSKFTPDMAELIHKEIPLNYAFGRQWLKFDYDSAGRTTGVKLPEGVLARSNGLEYIAEANRDTLIGEWASKSGIADPRDAVGRLRELGREFWTESGIYQSLRDQAAADPKFAAQFAEEIESVRRDLERLAGEIQKPGVNIFDSRKLTSAAREIMEHKGGTGASAGASAAPA